MGWELVASIITKAAATEKLQNDDYSQKFETMCANIYLFLFFFGIPQAYRRTPTLITLNIRISPVFVLITITNCSNQPRDFLLSYLFGCFPTEIQLVCSLCVVFFVFLFFYFFFLF